jgi:putative aldouronate transport system substrate-binding protein
MDVFNRDALVSKASGFVFDPEPVRQQIAAVAEAAEPYTDALYCGILDIDTEYPKMLDATEKAGIKEVIAEIQRQFDDWRASR